MNSGLTGHTFMASRVDSRGVGNRHGGWIQLLLRDGFDTSRETHPYQQGFYMANSQRYYYTVMQSRRLRVHLGEKTEIIAQSFQ